MIRFVIRRAFAAIFTIIAVTIITFLLLAATGNQAARLAGKSSLRISWEHILPNLTGLLLIQGTIQFSLGIIAEAGLSYIGLSAQPPTPSWGRMLNEAQTLTALAPYLAIFPGVAVLLFVLGLNLLGEGLRRRAELTS